MVIVWILAWFGLGIPFMFIAGSLRYDDSSFLRFISKLLRILFFASWWVYVSIQLRAEHDKRLADESRIRTFPSPLTILPKDIVTDKEYRFYVPTASRLLSLIREISPSEKELYFANKLFYHLKDTPYYHALTDSSDDLYFLYEYQCPEDVSIDKIIEILPLFALMHKLKGYWGFSIFEQWQNDVVRYGDRHFSVKIKKLSDQQDILKNLKHHDS